MALPASGWKHTSSSGATTPLGRASRASGSWPLLLLRLRSEGAGSSGDRRLGPRVGGRSTSTVCRANVLTTLFCGHWFRARDPHWRGRGLSEAATVEREELFRLLSSILPPWSDVRPPAELKHITKRRRRKQP